MHLFVLYLHPLLSRLERVRGAELVVAYADDISVIATSPHTIETMHDIFSRFERLSGAKLNVNKTTSIDVGFINGDPINVPWLQTATTVKILGVIYANSIRLMISLNWNALVGNFARQVWLHSMRCLNLQQKVTLLNTFITSKIWYLSSTIAPYSVHKSKITATMGSFLFSRSPMRIPIQQLARTREQGGLKLHLPAFKCKSLLVNRHLQEIDSMPYYKSFLFQDIPNLVNPPTSLPCLQLLCNSYNELPIHIRNAPCASSIHCFYADQTAEPRVQQDHPNLDWGRIWRNIASRELSSAVRSDLYTFVNEKYPCNEMMAHIGRAPSDMCEHCNTTVENLRHKFCECVRVADGFALLQRKVNRELGSWRRISFDQLLKPTLANVGVQRRSVILKYWRNYINYVDQVNDRIDIGALDFHLEHEM